MNPSGSLGKYPEQETAAERGTVSGRKGRTRERRTNEERAGGRDNRDEWESITLVSQCPSRTKLGQIIKKD